MPLLVGSLFLFRTASVSTGVGLPLILIDKFGWTADVGLVLASQMVPSILFGTLIGDMVARWGSRRCAVMSAGAAALVAMTIPLASSMWQLHCLVLLLGVSYAFGQPARMVLRSSVMRAGTELRGNGLMVTANRAPTLLGPALAALLLHGGITWVFMAAAILLSVSGLLLTKRPAVAIRKKVTPAAVKSATPGLGTRVKAMTAHLYGTSLRELAEAIRGDRVLVALTIHAVVWMIPVGLTRLLIPSLTMGSPGGNVLYGYVVAASGVGGMLGGMCVAWLAGLGRAYVYFAFGVLEALCWLVAPLLAGSPSLIALFFFNGLFASVPTVIYYAEVQRRLSPDMNGRYFALILPMCDFGTLAGTAMSGGLIALGQGWSVTIIAVLLLSPLIMLSGTLLRNSLWTAASSTEARDTD